MGERTREELNRELDWLQAVLRSVPNWVLVTDREGRIVFSNRGMPEEPPEALFGELAWQRLEGSERERLETSVRNVVATGETESLEVKARNSLVFNVRLAAVRQGDKIIGASIIAWDISELRQLQAHVLGSDRVLMLGMLAAGVAHEINNPLTYVLANLTWLERFVLERADSLDAREWVHASLEGVERIRAIVSDLRALSGTAADGREVAVDVRNVIDASARIAQTELRHRARLIRDYQDVPPVLASDARLGQVFLNLLVNAAQSIPEGDVQANTVRVATRTEGDRVVVEVSDTGAGIPRDVLDRIFDPFFTTKPTTQGTGLGLHISRNIVRSMKGTISVRSEPGRGSTFTISLPAAPGVAVRRNAHTRVQPSPAPKLRVLIVDDELGIVKVLRDTLPGFDVQIARSGREAIGLLEHAEFDLALCDLVMPDVTGMDVYEHVRQNWPGRERRFVFMTGGAFTERARAFLDSVSNPILEKPFSTQDLLDVIARHTSQLYH